ADIAAAQLTADPGWARVGQASAPYDEIQQLIVYRKGKPRPRDTLQLHSARGAVRAGSPQERILQQQKKTFAPGLKWVETGPTGPLETVAAGQVDYALVDAREFSFA